MKTTHNIELLKPLNPGADDAWERWVLYNVKTQRVIESAGSEGGAVRACELMQEHSDKHSHGGTYNYTSRSFVTYANQLPQEAAPCKT